MDLGKMCRKTSPIAQMSSERTFDFVGHITIVFRFAWIEIQPIFAVGQQRESAATFWTRISLADYGEGRFRVHEAGMC
jgi:hypothetical protein